MAEYLYGTYGELGESTGSVAASSGDVAVICGTAPVNLIRGYASAGIVNRPVKVSDYNDFKNALGTAQDWGKYTLAMVGEAFFNNPMGNLGPIYCVNVLDPDVHRSAGPTVKGLSFVNGKASFASEDIILDSFTLEGKTEGTDYEISYNFTDHKVTVKSADADNMLTGTIQASYHTVDVSDIGAGDIVGEETADGQLTGLQSAKLIYQGFNAVPNLYAAPGWSDRPEVYRALCNAATKMNGHWDGFVFADLPTSYEKVTYTAVEAQISDDPHAEGWYEQTGGTYAPSTDTVVNTEDTYYKRTFVEEIDASGDPSAQGYYEADGDGYKPTTDTEVQEGKSYYSVSYDRVTPNAGDDPEAEGWYVLAEGVYSRSSDTHAVSGTTYYVRNVETVAVDTIQKAVEWKAANGYTNERSKVFWPKAIGTDGNVYALSALALVEAMRVDDSHDGIPYETCGNKEISIQSQYFGKGSKNAGFDIDKSDALTSKGISTTVFWGGNWVIWGDSTAAYEFDTDMDPRVIFDVSLRMLMYLTNRFQRKWFSTIDKPFTRNVRDMIINSEQANLNALAKTGALIGNPTVTFDEVRNSINEAMQGRFYFNIAVTPTPPLKSATAYVGYTDEGFAAYFG